MFNRAKLMTIADILKDDDLEHLVESVCDARAVLLADF